MSDLVYQFTFPRRALGLDVTVTDKDGQAVSVTSPTLALTSANGNAYIQFTLDEADAPYSGSVESTRKGVFAYSSPGEVALAASIAEGGGGGTTDGVGAVFFGGGDLDSPLDNTYYFSNFEATDDPPRAPQRDDLMVIDSEDDTVINVVRSGLYDISLNVPVQPNNLVVPGGDGPYRLEAVVQVWVSGNSHPPAYDYNNRAQWDVKESASSLPTVFTNWTFPQVLLEGDTIKLAVKSYVTGGVEPLTGNVILDPDITFVLTYRGPVTL